MSRGEIRHRRRRGFPTNGYWFSGRPTVEEVRIDLRVVLQHCFPTGT